MLKFHFFQRLPLSMLFRSFQLHFPHALQTWVIIIIIMYIYHPLFNALSAHMRHINLNTTFYTYIWYYMETHARARAHTHARTHARTHTQKVMFVMLLNWFVSLNFELLWRSWDRIYILKNCTLDRVLLRCECFQVMMTSWFERLFLVFIFVFAVVFCHNETCTFEFALNIQVVNYASVECHHSATVHSYAHFLFLHCTVCLVLNSLSGPEQSVLSGSEQYILSGQFGSEQYVLSWAVWFWTVCLVLDSLVLNSMFCPGQFGSEPYVLSWTVCFWTVCLVLDSLVLNSMSCPGQSASEQYVLSWTV